MPRTCAQQWTNRFGGRRGLVSRFKQEKRFACFAGPRSKNPGRGDGNQLRGRVRVTIQPSRSLFVEPSRTADDIGHSPFLEGRHPWTRLRASTPS